MLQNEKKFYRQRENWHFEAEHHAELIQEFRQELETYGRIYMYRFRPDYEMRARPIMNIQVNVSRRKPLC
jgi:urocanate hydratase